MKTFKLNKTTVFVVILLTQVIPGVIFAQSRIAAEIRGSRNSIPVLTEDVVFLSTFDEPDLRNGQNWNHKRVVIRDSCGVAGSRCIDVSLVPYEEGSERVVFPISLKTAQEYSLNFDLKYDKNFEFVKGGKLIGLVPDNYITGCNINQPDGWSQRIMFDQDGTLFNYSYHQNREKPEGCGDAIDKRKVKLEKNIYYAITLHVKVNSKPELADGFSSIYVNGKLTSHAEGLRYRGVAGGKTQITKLLFSVFHGGHDSTWSPSQTGHIYFDNISVIKGKHVRTQPGSLGLAGIATDPTCEYGIKNQNICCPLSCGECGGAGCGQRPGGQGSCCTSGVLETAKLCSSSVAPCVITR